MRVRDAGNGVRRAGYGGRGCGVRSTPTSVARKMIESGHEPYRRQMAALSPDTGHKARRTSGRRRAGLRTGNTSYIRRKAERRQDATRNRHRTQNTPGAGRKTCPEPVGKHTGHRAETPGRRCAGLRTEGYTSTRPQIATGTGRKPNARHTGHRAEGGTDTERYSQQAPDAKHAGQRAESSGGRCAGLRRKALQARRRRCPRDDNQEGTSTRKAQRMSPEIHSGCDN